MCIRRLHHYSPCTSGFVPKIKNSVGFPCHVTRSMILDLPYTGNDLNRPFSSILKAINGPYPIHGEEEMNSNLTEKLLWRNYSLHIEAAYFFPFNSEQIIQPPSSSLFDGEPHCLSYMSLPLVEAEMEGT